MGRKDDIPKDLHVNDIAINCMQKHIESLEKQLDQKQRSIDTALSSILQMNMTTKLQAKLHKTVDLCDIKKGEILIPNTRDEKG